MSKVKIYSVLFREYTNGLRDTVHSEEFNKYLETRDLLIREHEFDYYKKFGGGFEALTFVGFMTDDTSIAY
jgi:hypothetical protein